MIIEIKKFGDVLISRPAGREAYLAAKAYILPKDLNEKIILDFADVQVLAPSWADEFVTKIKEDRPGQVELKNIDNPVVKKVLEFLEQIK